MPISEVAAGRYATALMDVAGERSLGDRCLRDIESFLGVIRKNQDLGAMLSNPTVPVQTTTALVRRLSERLGLDATTASFLAILASRRRLDGLERVVAQYRREMDKRAGRATGEVISASPVSDAQLARITDAVSRKTGMKVSLTSKVDPGLLGGVQVVVGDRVLDLSTRTYLESLKTRLLHNR